LHAKKHNKQEEEEEKDKEEIKLVFDDLRL
jgi:hypothetical protein